MKIFFDYQIFALQRYGGISRYFTELFRFLPEVAAGIDPRICAPFHINAYLDPLVEGVSGRRIPPFRGQHRILPRLNRVASRICNSRFRPDIFHETYYAHLPQKVCCPRVITVFDMIHERYPELFTGFDRKIAEIKAAAVVRADHVIAISEATKADVLEMLHLPERKITVIPLAASLEVPLQPTRLVGEPYLLYVGLRSPVKNFTGLLHAFAASPLLRSSCRLVCVGGGDFTAEEGRRLQELKVQDLVCHISADDGELAALYAYAEAFVYPSFYEGFGLPLLEAMRCGCPVACSRASSMPEIAGDAACYFDPEDEGSIRSVLEHIVEDSTFRGELVKRGCAREQLFSWKKCAEDTYSVYRKLSQ